MDRLGEAAVVGVPTAASRSRAFAAAIRHGETGFLAAAASFLRGTETAGDDAPSAFSLDPVQRRSLEQRLRAILLAQKLGVLAHAELELLACLTGEDTRLVLEVSGRSREVVLARALPEGFVPMGMHSALPARIARRGVRVVRVLSGSRSGS